MSEIMTVNKPKLEDMATELGRVMLPYCIEPVLGMTDTWAVYNRNYHPIGCDRWGKGEGRNRNEPLHFFYKRITQKQAAKIDHRGIRDDWQRGMWLYDDGSMPWRSPKYWEAYAKRLQALDNLKVKFAHKYQ